MDEADKILEIAEKVIASRQRLERASEACNLAQAEYDTNQAEYRKLIASLGAAPNGADPAKSVAANPLTNAGSLRASILQFMKGHPGVRLRLYEIEKAIDAEQEHKRLVWTLANMKRDGLVRHEGRGLWSVGREDDPNDYEPITDEPIDGIASH